ncbi:DedA family protein [Synechococcus sp. Cruz-9H2]|nr:DedA family protein [Synechococcus sp. Cruz-9H2]MCP9842207.1 DedA family protein [Synechococcus sp. Edmonson 11F2]MCP9854689.1 DedA family protein [Synechococcus sp. Cruz-9C9]MCP9861615.1 DedA family protein [Synechococcus sp. Cruz-7E5]MCP9869201.1 DedA family protein [Synechococcus sp. Cruz-7B9]
MPELLLGSLVPAGRLQQWAEAFLTLIGDTVETNPAQGYLLIGLALLLENVIPPIPSELVMPLSGFLIQQGKLQFIPVVVAALIGTVLGAWFWYGIGRLVNEQRLEHLIGRHGRLIGLKAADLALSRRWFARHGAAVVFWGRLVPGIRPFVSIPAGIELMPQRSFLFWTSAGSLLWILALVNAGLLLGDNYRQILDWIAPLTSLLSRLVLMLIALATVWLGVRALQRSSRR